MELRGPFFAKNLEHGATLAPPGGRRDVIRFQGPDVEIENTIKNAGFADYSTMGQIFVVGSDALRMLNYLIVNDLSKCKPGRGIYTMFLNEKGHPLDDTIIYHTEKNCYLVVTSTPGSFPILKALNEEAAKKDKYDDVHIIEASMGLLPVCGPRVRDILGKLAPIVHDMRYFDIVKTHLVTEEYEIPCYLARTGYSGELSFEIYVPGRYGAITFDVLMEAGKEFGLAPYGAETEESLRVEKCYHGGVYADDYLLTASPYQCFLGWTVKLDKGDFVGRDALIKLKEEGLETQLAGLEILGTDEVAPIGADVINKDGITIGKITCSTYGRRVKKSVAIPYVQTKYAKIGEIYTIRDPKTGKELKAEMVDTPFYDKEDKVLKG
ncbi:MAG: aminomethyl transferase family protein [Clostridiales bacterium]|jgi:aminomethyltransferase|nr:aminomethyl transferase family protein [Clostridiales bacterium]